jgi:glycerol-3-phosphate dehydrogenase
MGDGHFIFIVPWEDRVYAGTTDTRYSGDLDRPVVGDFDRDYILATVARGPADHHGGKADHLPGDGGGPGGPPGAHPEASRAVRTRHIPLGLHGSAEAAFGLAAAEAARLGLSPDTGIRLVRCYGDDWREAIRMIAADRSLCEPTVADLPVLKVELELARSREMAITGEDVFVRRTRLTSRDASVPLPSG